MFQSSLCYWNSAIWCLDLYKQEFVCQKPELQNYRELSLTMVIRIHKYGLLICGMEIESFIKKFWVKNIHLYVGLSVWNISYYKYTYFSCLVLIVDVSVFNQVLYDNKYGYIDSITYIEQSNIP